MGLTYENQIITTLAIRKRYGSAQHGHQKVS